MEAAEVIICAIGRADLTVARINPSQSIPSLFLILHYYRSFALEASVPGCFGMGFVNFLSLNREAFVLQSNNQAIQLQYSKLLFRI